MMISTEQKFRLAIVILVIGILVVISLTSSGASMIARANSYLDANDIGYQTENDDNPDAENDDDGDTSTSTTSAEGGDTGSTTASSSGTGSSETTYDPNLRARPTTENVVRPTDDNIWGGMKLDSMPQDKDISGGPTVNGALTANVGEFMGVRSKGAEPFFPDWEFGWYLNEGQVSIDRANAKTFRINIFCASYNDDKFPIPTDEFKAAYLNFWKVAGAGFITPEWGKLDVFDFDSNHPADLHDSASKIISAVAKKYPDWWPQVKAKTLPEEACLIMMGYRKYGSGGQYLGVYSRVKGPIDSTSLHELGHRSGGHSYMLGWDTKKKIYTMPGTLSNDGMCMMSYTTRYMDLYAPPWYHRNGWFRAEPGSYRYIQNGATYKMNMFHQWKADGRVHCLVALSPFTGEYVFYKISMIGWSKPGIETTLWLTGRTKNGKTRIPTAEIPDIETNNLMKGSNNDGFIRWVAYPAAWVSTGGNDMELRACRDPITGGGEDWIDPNTGLRFVASNVVKNWENYQCDVTVTYDASYLKRTLPPQITKIATGVYKHQKGSDLYDDSKGSVTDNSSTLLIVTFKNPNPGSTRPFICNAKSCFTQGGMGLGGPNNQKCILLGGTSQDFYFQAKKGTLAGEEDVAVICLGETYTRKIKFTHHK